MKFAESFSFGRENPTWTSDLVLSSLDGESRRPVGKVEWRGNPAGANWLGCLFFWLLFFGHEKTNSSGM